MKELLHRIRSVPKVIGVLTVDTRESRIYDSFPTQQLCADFQDVAAKLGKLSEALLDKGLLSFHFSDKTAFAYVDSHFHILILAETGVEINLLKTRLMELLTILNRQRRSPMTTEIDADIISPSLVDEDILVKALNELSRQVRQTLSGYIASRELKNARDKLLNVYQFFKGLYIDNSGNCAIINSPLTSDKAELYAALGQLYEDFRAAGHKVSPKTKLSSLTDHLGAHYNNQFYSNRKK
ncbi:MAG: hypothetical protein CO189_02620 [candidate division Zixibacteria bacterium CG_4_9_14_3_um_filter_46_8]|nr:MAG: hypothetical protein CO189_02620 [candidate division Zixibacteria bacterium CG_4_9_14_3_um_filter_46_8]